MRCPTGGDEFCGDAHGIVDRNGETQTVRFERSIDMVTAIRLSLGSIQRLEASTTDDGAGISNAFRMAHTV
jgi:hypothetical protein